ncbi:ethanolamine ammonia-lyase subunit EutC [Rhizosphaericola mali]|uniref:Ethanolamine ammonia-lyase small subunit n=1 Tax=Rhizosphaericola mali TaxID=2545455 RepID=A0A5P2G3S6_9BACT|nr:ethanolamine ammonia-lyase subunit EutC [Rhizosphaericola mali]QES87743.1 ethanolamine ammonia-lyase subunit EutC [Rhizosphaericola mali]
MGGKEITEEDFWSKMQQFTSARIGLGHTGISIPMKEVLSFKLAHAHARDAVYSHLDTDNITRQISELGIDLIVLKSQAEDRDTYLKRPDKGRVLSSTSKAIILDKSIPKGYDILIVAGDGLSAKAINENLIPLLENLFKINVQKSNYKIAPIVLVENARVAIGDEIGEILEAKIVIQLIGERPGLKSFDSLGAYITYAPKLGLTDEVRNCISNIRVGGLSSLIAADKIYYLIQEAFQRKLTGVQLKDNYSNDEFTLDKS